MAFPPYHLLQKLAELFRITIIGPLRHEANATVEVLAEESTLRSALGDRGRHSGR